MSVTDATIKASELYKIVLTNGVTAYFTSHDKAITYDSQSYTPIPIKRGNIGYHSDLQVDKVDITFGIVGVTLGTEALSIPTIVTRGYLKNSHVYIYIVDWSTSPATLLETRFNGYVTGDISYDAGSITLSCGSLLDRLSEKIPKPIYSEQCNHNIYDTYCGLVETDWQETGTVTGGTTLTIIAAVFAFTNKAEGYWHKGYIEFTSGDNNGVRHSIKKHYDGYVTMNLPFPYTPSPGDTFKAAPGCGGSGAICHTTFNNYANSLLFEYIPKPEVLYG